MVTVGCVRVSGKKKSNVNRVCPRARIWDFAPIGPSEPECGSPGMWTDQKGAGGDGMEGLGTHTGRLWRAGGARAGAVAGVGEKGRRRGWKPVNRREEDVDQMERRFCDCWPGVGPGHELAFARGSFLSGIDQ